MSGLLNDHRQAVTSGSLPRTSSFTSFFEHHLTFITKMSLEGGHWHPVAHLSTLPPDRRFKAVIQPGGTGLHLITSHEPVSSYFASTLTRLQQLAEAKSRKKAQGGTKNLSLLSFGEEAGEEESAIAVAAAAAPTRFRSAHDMLDDGR